MAKRNNSPCRPRDDREHYHEALLEWQSRLATLGIPFAPGTQRLLELVMRLSDDEVRRLCEGPSGK